MYIINISDTYVEWTFEMAGGDEYSIDDIIKVIVNNTNLFVKGSYPSPEPKLKILEKFLRDRLGIDPELIYNDS